MRQYIVLDQLDDFLLYLKTQNYSNETLYNYERDLRQLENYLAEIVKVSDLKEFRIKFNNDYVETGYNPGQRFLEIIEEIEKNNFIKNKIKTI